MTYLRSSIRFSASLLALTLAVAGASAQDAPSAPAPSAPAQTEGPVAEPAVDAAAAEEAPDLIDDEVLLLDISEDDASAEPVEVLVLGSDLAKKAGSVHVVSQRELERFEHDDVHDVVQSVPGVYVRGEDGFGLRPNIGMRGVNPERSKKVALMEDGILFGPAPYSAPAAYYFPLVSRMSRVEILKGPGAVIFGPNSIGGALNFHTSAIPSRSKAKADFALGSNGYGKGHLVWGTSGANVGYLIEAFHLQSDGFKVLDGGGETGFSRDEAMLKWRVTSDIEADVYQELELKLGLSLESSNETYLGLTDADFERQPYRRYRASAMDKMRWHRSQIALVHYVTPTPELELVTTAYRHAFTRGWNKLNGLSGASLPDVLADPGGLRNQTYYDVLTGATDSEGGAVQDLLDIGLNHRVFVSQGLQSQLDWHLDQENMSQHVKLGARLHNDSVERRHTQTSFAMQSGRITDVGRETELLVRNRGASTAFAVFATDEVVVGDVLVSPGARAEFIWTQFTDRALGEASDDHFQWAVLPGVGAYYQLAPWFGMLVGVYRGFSPVAPQARGAVETPEVELSINYEAGGRVHAGPLRAEIIGFFNDYSNLTRVCAQGTGCDVAQVDRQFDAGSVWVYGVEAMAEAAPELGASVSAPLRVGYTLTRSEFRTSFESEDPSFGQVKKGDELPYVPSHQLSASIGVEDKTTWGVDFSALYVSPLRESAGSVSEVVLTDEQLILAVAGRYEVISGGRLYGKVTNLSGATPIVARRPYGARPPAKRAIQLGFRYEY